MKYDGEIISVEKCEKRLKERTEKTKEKIRMATNPYNPRVIRCDFVDVSVYPPNFETIKLEQLTAKTEKRILQKADEVITGRFW